jgi:hypothetical protein
VPAFVLSGILLATSQSAEATVFVIWLEAETETNDAPDGIQPADQPECQPEWGGSDLLYRIGGNLQQRFRQWMAPNPHAFGPLAPPAAISAVIEAVDARASDTLYVYRELVDWSTRFNFADDEEISEAELLAIAHQYTVSAWAFVRTNVGTARQHAGHTAQELARGFRELCHESSAALLAAAGSTTSPDAWSDARWSQIDGTAEAYVQLVPTYNSKYYGHNEYECQETDEYGYDYEEDYVYDEDYSYEADYEYGEHEVDQDGLRSVLVPTASQVESGPATAASLIRPVLSKTASALDSLSFALANLSSRLHVAAEHRLPTAAAKMVVPRR